ncbi:hypothetical protein FKP32DRAFT_318084 [Trametes sanguinea]|nr:hypothetical protein FKP32DRAFT_318084 [Trametes sanguinea]
MRATVTGCKAFLCSQSTFTAVCLFTAGYRLCILRSVEANRRPQARRFTSTAFVQTSLRLLLALWHGLLISMRRPRDRILRLLISRRHQSGRISPQLRDHPIGTYVHAKMAGQTVRAEWTLIAVRCYSTSALVLPTATDNQQVGTDATRHTC